MPSPPATPPPAVRALGTDRPGGRTGLPVNGDAGSRAPLPTHDTGPSVRARTPGESPVGATMPATRPAAAPGTDRAVHPPDPEPRTRSCLRRAAGRADLPDSGGAGARTGGGW
ncbi:hypothetical protein SUDANB150_07178 [Streptomyces sp. enrichment culture]